VSVPCLSTHIPGTDISVAGFESYEVEDDVVGDMAEFQLASAIYAALVEGHACEISARLAAFVCSVVSPR
jgi:hypothetical protein